MRTVSTNLPSEPDLPLREKVSQLIFVRIGSNLPPVRRVEEDEDRIARLLEKCPVGGLLLFNGGPSTRATLDRLQSASKVPLLVASDIERGVGQQVKGYTLFPHAMAFEKSGATATTIIGEYARSLALEAREAGVHIAFAPVADVNTNPKNPIISTRAYSETPARAAELTAAYVRAAEAAGLLTTAKHFPGHGDTHQDSHDALPSVSRERDELAACELVPFQAAIDAGCSLVMTAHVAFPAIDPSGAPATVSPILLQQLLRNEMRFDGVICSDSLLMAGVRDCFPGEPEMALAALSAGVDLLLDLHEPSDVVDYLCNCVVDGKLAPQRIDDSLRRVWALKQRAFRNAETILNVLPDDSKTSVSLLAQRVALGAIEVLGEGTRPALPFDANAPLAAILLKPFETAIDPPEQPLAAGLCERFRYVSYVQFGPKSGAADYQSARELATSARQLLVAMIVRPAAWHAFGVRPEQKQFIEQLTQDRNDVVLASLGVPYVLQDYPNAAMRICTYSDVPVSQRALAEFLVVKS